MRPRPATCRIASRRTGSGKHLTRVNVKGWHMGRRDKPNQTKMNETKQSWYWTTQPFSWSWGHFIHAPYSMPSSPKCLASSTPNYILGDFTEHLILSIHASRPCAPCSARRVVLNLGSVTSTLPCSSIFNPFSTIQNLAQIQLAMPLLVPILVPE